VFASTNYIASEISKVPVHFYVTNFALCSLHIDDPVYTDDVKKNELYPHPILKSIAPKRIS
jgi:hypothetical protein